MVLLTFIAIVSHVTPIHLNLPKNHSNTRNFGQKCDYSFYGIKKCVKIESSKPINDLEWTSVDFLAELRSQCIFKNNKYLMKFKQPISFFFSVLLAAGLASCASSSEDKSKNAEDFDEANKSLKNQIEDVVYNIPSPSEIPYLLQATGAEFNETLLHDRKKVDSYNTKNDKAAMNLGVYVADIGYLTSYDKTQDAIDYLAACKTLADNLGLIGTFDSELGKQFEANISNKDSLAHLLDRTIKQAEAFLIDDNRNKLASLIVTGSFIEGLYISTGLIKSYPKNILPEDSRNLVLTPLMRVVLEQRKAVSELLKILSSVEQSGAIGTITADLKDLEAAYSKLNIEEQIKNNRADLVLTDKNLEEITTIVEKIRKDITE